MDRASGPVGGGESRPSQPTGARRALRLVDLVVWPLIALVVVVGFAAGVRHLATSRSPMSIIDEGIHADYVVHLWEGQLPYRGIKISDRVVYEASCGVGLIVRPSGHCVTAPAGAPFMDTYSTCYIHYPTFFVIADAFVRPPDGPGPNIDALRLYNWAVFVVGLASLWMLGLVARLRGPALAAMVSVPAAAAIFVYTGGYLNPSSTSLLLGALIAAGGIAWLRSPRGFWLLLVATLLAGSTAITTVMPAGAFFLYGAWVFVKRLRGERDESGFAPRWWQLLAGALAVVVPWFVWGRWIGATATVSNADVYGSVTLTTWAQLAHGAVQEALLLHSPWYAVPQGMPIVDVSRGQMLAVDVQAMVPALITLAVFGGLLTAVLARWRSRNASVVADGYVVQSPEGRHLAGVGACLLLIVWLYPSLLRLTNGLTFGIDHPIVARYSMSFTPLLVVLALKLVPARGYAWLMAGLGLVMMGSMAYLVPTLTQ